MYKYQTCIQPLTRPEQSQGEPQSQCPDSPWLMSSTLPPARRLPVAVVTTRHQGLRAAAPVARRKLKLRQVSLHPQHFLGNKYALFHQDVWSKEQQAYSDQMFGLWIAGSYLPVTVSKDPGVHRFLASLNSQVRGLNWIV